MRRLSLFFVGSIIIVPTVAGAEEPNLATKWVRNSAEYWTLTHQVYQSALDSIGETKLKKKQLWTVVLDVDETVLDNSAYQLELDAYGESFGMENWSAWCEREQAGIVPGAQEFITFVHKKGGRVAFITNRHEGVREATQSNLDAHGLWGSNDLLCLSTDDAAYTKVVRRGELRTGQGACAWQGKAAMIVAYVGDQIGDLPVEGEVPDEQSGQRFLLPNPMYGGWMHHVTRPM